MSRRRMVGPGRLELPTSRLSGVRSNHLSYGPIRGELQPKQRGPCLCEKEKRGRRVSPYRQGASTSAAYYVSMVT